MYNHKKEDVMNITSSTNNLFMNGLLYVFQKFT